MRSRAWIISRALLVILLSGLVGATLLRVAPGFGIDERTLDPRLSAETQEALARAHAAERNLLVFYGHFLGGLLKGEAGGSAVFGQPVGRLITERSPVTIRAVALGLAWGWTAALICAIVASLQRRTYARIAVIAINGTLLSIPAAILATLSLLFRLSPAIAIAAVLFPRIFPHLYEQLLAGRSAPHVVMARARGKRERARK